MKGTEYRTKDFLQKALVYLTSKVDYMPPVIKSQLQDLEVICHVLSITPRMHGVLHHSCSGYLISLSIHQHFPHWDYLRANCTRDDLYFPILLRIVKPKTLPEILVAVERDKKRKDRQRGFERMFSYRKDMPLDAVEGMLFQRILPIDNLHDNGGRSVNEPWARNQTTRSDRSMELGLTFWMKE